MDKLLNWAEGLSGVPLDALKEELPWMLLAILGFYGALYLVDLVLRPGRPARRGREKQLPAPRELL